MHGRDSVCPLVNPTKKIPLQRGPKMANDKPNTPNSPVNPAPVAPKVAPALNFEVVEALPQATEINAITNPFQEQVNALAKAGKGAVKFKCAKTDEKWARTMIRNACTNISKGAKTKAAPIPGDDENVMIYFSVGPKMERKSNK